MSDAARKLIGKLDYLVQYFYITNVIQKCQVENNVCNSASNHSQTRRWALESASFGFRIACIAPGLTSIPILSWVSLPWWR